MNKEADKTILQSTLEQDFFLLFFFLLFFRLILLVETLNLNYSQYIHGLFVAEVAYVKSVVVLDSEILLLDGQIVPYMSYSPN